MHFKLWFQIFFHRPKAPCQLRQAIWGSEGGVRVGMWHLQNATQALGGHPDMLWWGVVVLGSAADVHLPPGTKYSTGTEPSLHAAAELA